MYDETRPRCWWSAALTGLSSALLLAAQGMRRASSNAAPICSYVLDRARVDAAHGRAVSPARIGARRPQAASYVSSDRYAFAPIRAETLAEEEYTPESTRRKV
jgi:hypothetical protein